MDDFHVLSSEEVDAILKATQDKPIDAKTNPLGAKEQETSQLNYALNAINDLSRMEYEKTLIAFLRKKIVIKNKPFNLGQLSEIIKASQEKNVYIVFRILSKKDCYGMFIAGLPILHQTINILFGGQVNKEDDSVMEVAGKIGPIVSEKICLLCLGSFANAVQEFGGFTFELNKTSTLPNLTSNLNMEDQFYCLDTSVFFDEIETGIKMLIPEDFFNEFIRAKMGQMKHRDKDFWRSAIKSQVVDSYVNVSVSLPDINMKISEFMSLKEGDMIPITDPTLVYVCLNNLKLFRALAAQANSKRVAKIVSQI